MGLRALRSIAEATRAARSSRALRAPAKSGPRPSSGHQPFRYRLCCASKARVSVPLNGSCDAVDGVVKGPDVKSVVGGLATQFLNGEGQSIVPLRKPRQGPQGSLLGQMGSCGVATFAPAKAPPPRTRTWSVRLTGVRFPTFDRVWACPADVVPDSGRETVRLTSVCAIAPVGVPTPAERVPTRSIAATASSARSAPIRARWIARRSSSAAADASMSIPPLTESDAGSPRCPGRRPCRSGTLPSTSHQEGQVDV